MKSKIENAINTFPNTVYSMQHLLSSVKKLSGGAKDEKGVGRKKPSRSIASNRSVRHRRGENTQSLQACVQRTAFSKFIICLSFSNTAKKE